jgi:hypothetical protein
MRQMLVRGIAELQTQKSPGRGRPGLLRSVGVPFRQTMCIVGGHNDAIKQNAAILPELQFLFAQINYELYKPLGKAQFTPHRARHLAFDASS